MQLLKQAEIEGIEHEEMHGKLQYVASKGIKSQIDGQSVCHWKLCTNARRTGKN